MNSIYHYSFIKIIALHHLNLLNISWDTFIANGIFIGPQIPRPMPQEVEMPSGSAKVKKSKKAKETKVVEKPETYKTYQRGAKKVFAVDRQVFTPPDVEGALPSSSPLRQMLSPQTVEGAFPSSSTQYVQVQQLHEGKEKMQVEYLDDEEERDFDLTEHDEPEQHYIHHGIEIINLEAQDEATIENIIIQEKEAQIQALMDNLERAKYVITYLE